MITLFNINNYNIDTSKLGNILHGEIVEEFEQAFDSEGFKYNNKNTKHHAYRCTKRDLQLWQQD